MKPFIATFGAIAMTLAAGQAMAQLSPGDKTFVTKAASGGLAEVELGELAKQKADDPKIKQFGQLMVTDHTVANQELQQISLRQKFTISGKLDAADQATKQRLENLSGQTFDVAYIQEMVQDHQRDIADFRHEAASGHDKAVINFAQRVLPILQHHLQMAQALSPQ